MAMADDRISLDGVVASVHHLRARDSDSISSTCEYILTVEQLPAVIDWLRRHGEDESWLVILFKTSRVSPETDDQYLNLQYCKNHGVVRYGVGFAWPAKYC